MKKQKIRDRNKKMEDDRADLYSAIVKLKTSIDELNQGKENDCLMHLQKLIGNSTKFIQNYLMEEMQK